MLQATRVNRAQGCLLGMAVGDALGGPLEGLSAQQIHAHYGTVDDYVDGAVAWKRKPHRWRLAGLYTDDTQQALAVCDVLLESEKLDAARLVDFYLKLAEPASTYMGSHRGVGKSFHNVLKCLNEQIAPSRTGQPSAGIGAAARIAPIPLYYAGMPDAMFEAVMNASLITHRDIRALAGAMAIAHAVRRLAAGADREPSFLLRLAGDVDREEKRIAAEFGDQVDKIDEHKHAISTSIARVESLLDRPRGEALAAIVEEANRRGAEPVCKRPTMGFAPSCIPTCLLIFMTSESFQEALVEVVNLGGDADSAGAMTGALAGAHHGASQIPRKWLDKLLNREGIEARGEALARRTTADLEIPDYLQTERELTDLEKTHRDQLMRQVQSRNGPDLGANKRI